jgi:hypothetical protein
MSTQFDQVFDGLSKNSLTLEDACRVLYSESLASPENLRVCCARIESELSQGRISSDAAQLLLDALGERSKEDHDVHPTDEVWVDVPLEPVTSGTPRAGRAGETAPELDLTMDDLLAALDRRGTPLIKSPVDFAIADEMAAPVEWVEWEPEEPETNGAPPSSSAITPAIDPLLETELDLVATAAPAAEPTMELAAAAVGDVAALSEISAQREHTAPVTALAPQRHATTRAEASDTEPVLATQIASRVEAVQPVVLLQSSQPAAVLAESDAAIDEVFAPRVEHVLKESMPMAPGALLKERYRIVGPLAPGGLGQLFEAIDTKTAGQPHVALKLIEVDWQEEPRAFETLQAIVRHVRRLRHPNILAILDIDRDDKHVIIAMELLRGCWLSSLISKVRGRGVGYAVAWNIISGIANGLAYAHQHGAVHSELNPHMVFLTEEGVAKIVGFGLAHAMPMSTEPLPALAGHTLRSYADAYCATHWLLGSTPQGVDDLYPLGVIAYELLTGAHPFKGLSPAAAAAEHLQPMPIPGLDRRIRRVIERCLSFDRKVRPESGASFLAHIEPADELLDQLRERFKHPG